MVFIDDSDRKVGCFGRGASGSVDRNGEEKCDERQDDRVGADAAHLLDRQPIDVGKVQPQLGEPIASGHAPVAEWSPLIS